MALGWLQTDAVFESRRADFIVSTDRTRLDVDVIHGFLTNSYWAKGIPRETVARSLEHSLCFGVYDGSGAQVGFARVVTDFATVAYLGDVFVLETHRGHGLSKFMMECIMGHPALQGFEALDPAHARCPRSLPAIRIYAVEVGRSLYGTAPA